MYDNSIALFDLRAHYRLSFSDLILGLVKKSLPRQSDNEGFVIKRAARGKTHCCEFERGNNV